METDQEWIATSMTIQRFSHCIRSTAWQMLLPSISPAKVFSPMKKMMMAFVFALATAHCGHAQTMQVSAPAGVMLSTNLSAALVKLNTAMKINSGSLLTVGRPLALCPGGDCDTAPIVGLPSQGCTSSPENPTFLLAVLGLTGLVLGRAGYLRRQSRTISASAA